MESHKHLCLIRLGVFCWSFGKEREINKRKLAVDIAAVANTYYMDCFQMGMDVVDYAIVTITQAIAALLFPLQRFATVWCGGERINERDDAF